MDLSQAWKRLFTDWPEDVTPKGIIIASYDEQIPFDGFLVGDALLVINRATPDASGARRVVLPYAHIQGLKFTEVVKNRALRQMGFGNADPK